MKNQVVIVSSYEFSDTNATKARLYALLDNMSHNFQVTFICPGYDSSLNDKNIKIINLGKNLSIKSFLFRALYEIFYAIKVRYQLKKLGYPNIIITIPSIFLLILLINKKYKSVVDVRDLVWDYLPKKNYYQRLMKQILKYSMLSLLRHADTIFTTNNQEKKYLINNLRNYYGDINVLTNGINKKRFCKISKIKETGKKDIILYIGNIGLAQNLITLIDVIKIMPSLELYIIGKGVELNRLKDYTKKNQIKNISFLGGLNWNEILPYYEKANMLYAQISEEYKTAIPSKLYEYLSTGIPIIFAGTGASENFLSKFENVMTIPPNNSNALKNAIEKIWRMEKKISNKNKFIIEEKYIRENQVDKIMPHLNKILSVSDK
tara:strand:- start:1140 stop:2270 length:1131 start_codon:yes stop_codon:yes gene_type:complete